MINGIWKGILIKACCLVICKISLGISDKYKYILTGNTAISSNIMPNAPNLRVLFERRHAPRIISNRPLINISSSFKGIKGGIILTKYSGDIKCFIPIIMYKILIEYMVTYLSNRIILSIISRVDMWTNIR